MEAVLNKDDYRTFTQKVQILESKGYDLQYLVEHSKDSDKYKITIHGNHSIEELDKLTE